ncbi:MAG: SurA N-terminal domain-containing protein, partial [Verrucomicrobiota bacterium]
MFASIRRHQKWLFGFIVAAVIISFVWYFNPNQTGGYNGGTGSGGDRIGTIYGEPLTRDEFLQAKKEAALWFRFYSGTWPDQDQSSRFLFNEPDRVQNRILLARKIKELNIRVGEEAIAEWVTTFFQDRNQRGFNRELYDQIVKVELPARGYSPADFMRYAKNEVGQQHLIALFGVTGKLVTPQEAEAQFRRENEQVDSQIALFYSSNYLSSVNIDPAALGTYYTNSASMYRIPDRIQVAYVKFDVTNYLAAADARLNQITNLSQRL